MSPFVVRLTKELEDKLDAKSRPQRRAIVQCLERLQENPRHPGLRTSKVQGRRGVFEARASRADRVTWFWQASVIVIENHCGHEIL
jgi:mRNA interferase RelE/StbE